MAARKTAWHGPVTDKLNVDELAKLLKLSTWDKIDDMNVDYVAEAGHHAYQEALREGKREPGAEKARESAEHEASNEIYTKWHDAVLAAAEKIFGYHHLDLHPVQGRRKSLRPYEYKVVPSATWEKALREIIQTINGVGMFGFSSMKEFLESGPYATARIGTLTHLQHMVDYPRVYGTPDASHIFERAWR